MGAEGTESGENAEESRESDAKPPDRCGFEFDANVGFGEASPACCWRETYEDADHCQWHLDEGKEGAVSEYKLLAEGDAPFVGFVLRGASLAGSDVLADRTLARADLSEANLQDADLSGANLQGADLSGADLSSADLCGSNLRDASFEGANLDEADLSDVDARRASFESANMENALLTRSNLRNASLHDARLYEVGFSDTWINNGTGLDDRCIYERDADAVLDRDDRDIARHDAAAWTYRALEDLCRENALPELTRHYFVREKESRRKAAWETDDYVHAVKSELSRWVMEYGSNPWRIVTVSNLVIVLWAVLYPLTGGIEDTATGDVVGYVVEEPTDAPHYYVTVVLLKSLYFSVVTFTTLGYGDMQPLGTWARVLATVETGLGSVLLALLVFVLSRSVTW